MGIEASHFTGRLIICLRIYPGSQQRNDEKFALLAHCNGNPPIANGFHAQMVNNAEIMFSRDIIMKM